MHIREYFKKASLLLINIIFISGLFGQETTIYFQASTANIANPERGWYDQHTTHSGGATLGSQYKSLDATYLQNERENDNITLLLRLFMLHEFIDTPGLSQEYLDYMQADFDAIRSAGVKCIVRFAYSLSESAEVWDATPEIVFAHIESLGEVLSKNSDVIAAVQAGFVGVWGEWYYTRNFGGAGFSPDSIGKLNRTILVESLLNILPENIVVEARTPAQMKYLVKTDDPISEEEAFDGSFKSRIGHHNDCFVASSSDYGTYTNVAEDIAYLHESTKYTITGGETCDASNTYSDCANSVSRLVDLHWTYMNRGYNRKVYDKWEEQGCFEEVDIALGYRISLLSATIDNAVNQGSPLHFSFEFSNDGYAAPTQTKPIQIVLTHTSSGELRYLNYEGTNNDIRFWLPGEVLLEGNVSIPADLEDGNYKLGIRFPDKDELLSLNPAYSIQLANAGTWDSELGINSLNHIVSVGAGGVGSLPIAPSELDATTVSYTQVDLSWTDNSNDESGFEIMRAADDGMAWESVITLDSDTEVYSDNSLEKGTFYHYIIRSINDYGFSAWSDSATAATLGVYAHSSQAEPFMELYPNPLVNSNLSIQFQDQAERQIFIYNITGAKVLEASTSQAIFQVNGGFLIPGVYFVSMYQSGIILNKKFIVL